MDNKERFTAHADNYVKYRPSYPAQAIDCILEQCGLTRGMSVADIGSGTGKLTTLLLARGLHVYAVEPNAAMRSKAEQLLGETTGFYSVDAGAEETGLPAASVDAVTVAQAFHWFDQARFKLECKRILRSGGKAALVWNQRDTSNAFMKAYEAAIQAHHDEIPNETRTNIGEEVYATFFTQYDVFRFAASQCLDLEGLIGRALSSSYSPKPGHSEYEPLCASLRALFEQFQVNGQVEFIYRTEVVVGTV